MDPGSTTRHDLAEDDDITELNFQDISTCRIYTDATCGLGSYSKCINDQRLEGKFCDVILVAEEDSHHNAHRCVLVAASTYFARMFEQMGFEESNKGEVELQGVPGDALASLLDFIYTGALKLTVANIHDIVAVADYLLIPGTRKFCSHFMERLLSVDVKPTPEDVFMIFSTTDSYGFESVRAQAFGHICEKFQKLRLSSSFVELPLQAVLPVLAADGAHCIPEEMIWEDAIRWLEHDLDERKRHLEAVMNCVRFPLLSTDTLSEAKSHKLIQDSPCVNDWIEEAMQYNHNPVKQSKMQSSKTRPRGKLDFGIFCLVGTDSFYMYNIVRKKWFSLPPPLPVQLASCEDTDFSFRLVHDRQRLYAIGMMRFGSNMGKYAIISIQSYDNAQNVWREETLPIARENTIFLCWEKNLAACSANAIELYDYSEKKWTVLCQHNFLTYDFVMEYPLGLAFSSLSSGMLTFVNVNRQSVEVEVEVHNLNQTVVVGPLRGIAAYQGDNLLLTSKSRIEYEHHKLNMSRWMANCPSLCPGKKRLNADNEPNVLLRRAWTREEIPECLDRTKFWHIESSGGMTWIMASHPSLVPVYTAEENVDDSVPFFRVKNGKWERLPGIPEQPEKPISLCASLYQCGTSAACRY